MAIIYQEESKQFHLFNDQVSFIFHILPDGQIGNLYHGKRINDRDDFTYLWRGKERSLAVYWEKNDYFYSRQYTKSEYPNFGTGDFHYPAFEIEQENGSKISCFRYNSHNIFLGKKKLRGLPATYIELPEEAETLEIELVDKITGMKMVLSYSIFRDFPVLTKSVRFNNEGNKSVILNRALSACMDFPDSRYEMLSLTGAWARERHIKKHKLHHGVQQICSMRGASSAEYNPFIALKRPEATEDLGEVWGFSLVYSGNHMEQVEVDTDGMTRVLIGIHPDTFSWKLVPTEEFQTPETVIIYSNEGLNGMSRTFHKLYRTRLVRGYWRDKVRPILINNWEATEMEFTQDKIIQIAQAAKELGIELFVLDDGWFGNRENDKKGLGDWYVKNFDKLPEGISGLAKRIENIGLKFGLWFEPEMVNMDSDLYRKHPEWLICTPEREPSPGRNQYVLDFTNQEVRNYIFILMEKVLEDSHISYVKWDMNRYITECYSNSSAYDEQGKVYHNYILGVYDLYEKLIQRFPKILFESCASGGARFDPGMLYYAPQGWVSDDTDAIERLMIQYGTSIVYPISSLGAHVSAVPNIQVGRITSMETRGNVAMFGTFGYELDLEQLDENERKIIKKQITFFKEQRELIQSGEFYRLVNPFEANMAAWMVVDGERKKALVGVYKILNVPNHSYEFLCLKGLDPQKKYRINGIPNIHYGDELMYIGIPIDNSAFGFEGKDFSSVLLYIEEY